MANLYYGNIAGLSDGDIKTISSSKPADKLVLFGNGEINFDELTALNEAAAKIEFVKAESEAAMYSFLEQTLHPQQRVQRLCFFRTLMFRISLQDLQEYLSWVQQRRRKL